ncbi:antibiotic biosynthesis monooxygenase family protein [Paenibacillus sp. YAF4_2]|uniref:antibiotic biosynthesis monooxygenase family protein n=1 Tax=Paenibacillus sp. YAF4_2 TaxID=3233085 RepID=UPI003F959906
MKPTTYYAVIFTSQRRDGDEGYSEMADRMDELARKQPGFIDAESVRDAAGVGITVSYWESLEAIRSWKQNEEHLVAQENGKQAWYESYKVRICKVEREYSF